MSKLQKEKMKDQRREELLPLSATQAAQPRKRLMMDGFEKAALKDQVRRQQESKISIYKEVITAYENPTKSKEIG